MKTRILMLLIVCFSAVSFAQQPLHKRYDVLKSKRVVYFTNELKLDAATAEKFWPIYNELEAMRMRSHESTHKLFHGCSKDDKTEMTDEMYTKLADAFIDQRVEYAEMEREYHLRFKEVLTPKQLVNFYKADQNFRKEMIKMFRDSPRDVSKKRQNEIK